MAIDSKRIQVSELDFDQIKGNLKNFLKGQNQFSDYDFEGSGLSVLLDVLAYNTHYNALYTNLAVNEMFLDSASKRASVVSIAKTLGYTPSSVRSARAIINMAVTNPNQSPSTLTLPKYSPFSTIISGSNYTFYTLSEYTIVPVSGNYTFTNVELIEGRPLSFRYTVDTGQQYIIPNQYADISTLNVRVQESSISDTCTTFTAATSVVQLASDSHVYFIKDVSLNVKAKQLIELFENYYNAGSVTRILTKNQPTRYKTNKNNNKTTNQPANNTHNSKQTNTIENIQTNAN